MDESSILFWEEPDVHSFFCSLGFKGYEQQIKEHQISGEILVQCDHEALKDVGIHSVGQRLAILKAVYQLKLQNDVPIEEGHWVPPSEFMDQIMVESPAGIIPPERMFELLRERDDRIRALETSIARLNEQVLGMRDEVYGLSRSLYTKEPPIPINKLRPNQASPTASGFARQHLRNGSLAAGPSTSSHAQNGTGTDGSGSPGVSPANSPIRSTHDVSHASEQSAAAAANVTAPPAGALLSYSTSLRRRAAKLADVTHGANGLLGTPSHPTAGGDGAPVSPVPSPLPSSVVVSPANAAEPPTPTAAYPQVGSSSSATAAAAQWNGEHTPVSDTVPLSQLLSTTVTPSGLMSGLGSGSNNRQLEESAHGYASQRPATSSTSPSSAPITLPNRPSTSATSLSAMSDMTQALMTPSTSTTTSTGSGSASADRGGRTSSSSSTIDNPYKSFRVTLEDPCYKVLPAALKKYKINDDWRQYALFICYGSQERCLSYDEKPLLLFQKLKDSKQNPVFMLRHIKDIKSPIAHALEKHTTRREKRAREGKHITGEGKEGSVRDFSRATRLHHPSNLQPVKASPSSPNPGATGGEEEKDKVDDDKEGKGQGYALAIYPYMADREDEFDVAVGDTFVILNKTKGWWVVHRDTKAKKGSDIVRSGWVPQGCLLETSVPPSSFSTTPVSSSTPINPLSIVSMSTPGLALMDYTQRGSDEVNMRKGDKLRVFKRYNHWSYVIKEATGERGWTPSWFVGKLSSSSSGSAQSTPTSALATGMSGHTPSSATPLSALPVAKDATNLPAMQGGETTPTSASMSFS